MSKLNVKNTKKSRQDKQKELYVSIGKYVDHSK